MELAAAGQAASLRKEPKPDAEVVARLEPGFVFTAQEPGWLGNKAFYKTERDGVTLYVAVTEAVPHPFKAAAFHVQTAAETLRSHVDGGAPTVLFYGDPVEVDARMTNNGQVAVIKDGTVAGWIGQAGVSAEKPVAGTAQKLVSGLLKQGAFAEAAALARHLDGKVQLDGAALGAEASALVIELLRKKGLDLAVNAARALQPGLALSENAAQLPALADQQAKHPAALCPLQGPHATIRTGTPAEVGGSAFVVRLVMPAFLEPRGEAPFETYAIGQRLNVLERDVRYPEWVRVTAWTEPASTDGGSPPSREGYYVLISGLQAEELHAPDLIKHAAQYRAEGHRAEEAELLSRAVALGGVDAAAVRALVDASLAATDPARAVWALGGAPLGETLHWASHKTEEAAEEDVESVRGLTTALSAVMTVEPATAENNVTLGACVGRTVPDGMVAF